MSTRSNPLPVRRRIYFLSGFDPRGAAYYHRFFTEQLNLFSLRQGCDFRLGRRPPSRGDRLLSRWQLEGLSGQDHELVFLHWDDIARQHWPRQPLLLIWDYLCMYVWYVLRGGNFRIARWSRRVALVGHYPVMALSLAVILALAIGVLAMLLGRLLLPSLLLAAAVTLAFIGLILRLSWALAEHLGIVWLVRSIRFTHQLGQARDSDLRWRVQSLAQEICALEAESGAEEITLVGHSSGSFVMVMMAAELRRQDDWSCLRPRLRLLSLGQNLANLAVHPGARRFHQDLIELAQEPRPPWADITSHHDYLCFAGVDPYRSCGLPIPSDGPYPNPRIINLAAARGIRSWWQLMSCQFDLHFDYLRSCRSDSAEFDFWSFVLDV